MTCKVDGCASPAEKKGMCNKHYLREWKSASAHLRWATRAENRKDMVDHGRSLRGERNHFTKLGRDEVREIRALLGSLPQRKIADQFGVTQTAINSIATGRTWAWLEA